MSVSANQIADMLNYLVPSEGRTHAVKISGTFSATVFNQDWRNFSVENFPFQPQGVFVDNSAGAGDLTITIQPLGWSVVVPAGTRAQSQFPAPDGQTMQITGDGIATCIFVDFPVLPNAGAVQILGTPNVNIASPNPLPTSPTVNASGVPFQNTEVPVLVTPYNAQINVAGGGLTATITPAVANQYLRKLLLSFSNDVDTGAAGEVTVTVTLNAGTVLKFTVYMPAAGPDTLGTLDYDFDFAKLGLSAANGDLVVTLGTALAAGVCDINAYFG